MTAMKIELQSKDMSTDCRVGVDPPCARGSSIGRPIFEHVGIVRIALSPTVLRVDTGHFARYHRLALKRAHRCFPQHNNWASDLRASRIRSAVQELLSKFSSCVIDQ